MKTISVSGEPARPLSEIAKEWQMSVDVLRTRLALGWSIDKALTTKVRQKGKIGDLTVDGVTMSFKEWSEVTGIKESVLRYRIYLGWDPKRAIDQKVVNRSKRNGKN